MAIPTAKLYFMPGGPGPREVRRLGPGTGVLASVSALTDRIRQIWPDVKQEDIRVSWKDSDGDDILVERDEELEEATKHTVDDILHLYVRDKSKTLQNRRGGHRHGGRHGSPGRRRQGFRRMMEAEGASGMPRGFRRRMREFGLPPWMMEEGDIEDGEGESSGEEAGDTSPGKPQQADKGESRPAKDGKPSVEFAETGNDEANQPGTSGTQKEAGEKSKSDPGPTRERPGWRRGRMRRAWRRWLQEAAGSQDPDFSSDDPQQGETDPENGAPSGDDSPGEAEEEEGQWEGWDPRMEGPWAGGRHGRHGAGTGWGMMGMGWGRGGGMGFGGRRGGMGMGCGMGGRGGRMGWGMGGRGGRMGMGWGMGGRGGKMGMGWGMGGRGGKTGMGCGRRERMMGMGCGGRGGMKGWGKEGKMGTRRRWGMGMGGDGMMGMGCGRKGMGWGMGGMKGWHHGKMGHHGWGHHENMGRHGEMGHHGHHGKMGHHGHHGEMGHHGHHGEMGRHGKMGHHGTMGHRGHHGMMGRCGMMGPRRRMALMRRRMMARRWMRRGFPWKHGQMGQFGPRMAGRPGFGMHRRCGRFPAGSPHMRRQRMVQCMLGRRIRRMRAKIQWLQRMREMKKNKMDSMLGLSGDSDLSGTDGEDSMPRWGNPPFSRGPRGTDGEDSMPRWGYPPFSRGPRFASWRNWTAASEDDTAGATASDADFPRRRRFHRKCGMMGRWRRGQNESEAEMLEPTDSDEAEALLSQ